MARNSLNRSPQRLFYLFDWVSQEWIDVSSDVLSFEIKHPGGFCYDISISFATDKYFILCNPLDASSTLRIKVILEDYNKSFQSHQPLMEMIKTVEFKSLIEERTIDRSQSGILYSIWGRSAQALLTEKYSPSISDTSGTYPEEVESVPDALIQRVCLQNNKIQWSERTVDECAQLSRWMWQDRFFLGSSGITHPWQLPWCIPQDCIEVAASYSPYTGSIEYGDYYPHQITQWKQDNWHKNPINTRSFVAENVSPLQLIQTFADHLGLEIIGTFDGNLMIRRYIPEDTHIGLDALPGPTFQTRPHVIVDFGESEKNLQPYSVRVEVGGGYNAVTVSSEESEARETFLEAEILNEPSHIFPGNTITVRLWVVPSDWTDYFIMLTSAYAQITTVIGNEKEISGNEKIELTWGYGEYSKPELDGTSLVFDKEYKDVLYHEGEYPYIRRYIDVEVTPSAPGLFKLSWILNDGSAETDVSINVLSSESLPPSYTSYLSAEYVNKKADFVGQDIYIKAFWVHSDSPPQIVVHNDNPEKLSVLKTNVGSDNVTEIVEFQWGIGSLSKPNQNGITDIYRPEYKSDFYKEDTETYIRTYTEYKLSASAPGTFRLLFGFEDKAETSEIQVVFVEPVETNPDGINFLTDTPDSAKGDNPGNEPEPYLAAKSMGDTTPDVAANVKVQFVNPNSQNIEVLTDPDADVSVVEGGPYETQETDLVVFEYGFGTLKGPDKNGSKFVYDPFLKDDFYQEKNVTVARSYVDFSITTPNIGEVNMLFQYGDKTADTKTKVNVIDPTATTGPVYNDNVIIAIFDDVTEIPLQGMTVVIDGETMGTTDSMGTLPLDGSWLIGKSHTIEAFGGEYDSRDDQINNDTFVIQAT